MLSAYTWSQFGLFILALVTLYYAVVGLVYYRDELTALVQKGRKGTGPQLAGAAAASSPVPALVRPTSAFGQAVPPAGEARPDQAAEVIESLEAGAADNLPTAAEPVVGGELPESTATATGQDESTSEEASVQATAAGSAQPEAQLQDEIRREEADEVDERLAALVRQESSTQSAAGEPFAALEPASILSESIAGGYEPLATFEEPVASLLDIITAEPTQELVAAESVSEYIALLQAGQDPPMPAALQGTCLAEQMAQHLSDFNAELNALLEADEV